MLDPGPAADSRSRQPAGNPRWRRAQGARSIRGMPKYELREDAATVSIEVSGVGDERQERELLEAFDDCRSGRCSCPTDQYDKLASMDVDRDADSITLRLSSPSRAPSSTPRSCTPVSSTRSRRPRAPGKSRQRATCLRRARARTRRALCRDRRRQRDTRRGALACEPSAWPRPRCCFRPDSGSRRLGASARRARVGSCQRRSAQRCWP